MASPGNPRAAFAARGRRPLPACPDESNGELARRGRRFRCLCLDRGHAKDPAGVLLKWGNLPLSPVAPSCPIP